MLTDTRAKIQDDLRRVSTLLEESQEGLVYHRLRRATFVEDCEKYRAEKADLEGRATQGKATTPDDLGWVVAKSKLRRATQKLTDTETLLAIHDWRGEGLQATIDCYKRHKSALLLKLHHHAT